MYTTETSLTSVAAPIRSSSLRQSNDCLTKKSVIIPAQLELAVDRAIEALTNPKMEVKDSDAATPTLRICILHIVVAFEASISSTLLRGVSTTDNDAISFQTLFHSLFPINWKLVGRQSVNNSLYCVSPQKLDRSNTSTKESSNSDSIWLAYFDEKWQNVCGSKFDSTTLFQDKHCVILSCPVLSLLATVSPLLTMHDVAVKSLFEIYQTAQKLFLYPYLILLGGKGMKTALRQSIAQQLTTYGFLLDRVHWHGLSSEKDAVFAKGITRFWHTLTVCKL